MDYHYDEVRPVDPYLRTVWLVEFKTGGKVLEVWHGEAKIENVVPAMKARFPGHEFTVAAFDVGSVIVAQVQHSMHNGRKVNQDMMMEI